MRKGEGAGVEGRELTGVSCGVVMGLNAENLDVWLGVLAL